MISFVGDILLKLLFYHHSKFHLVPRRSCRLHNVLFSVKYIVNKERYTYRSSNRSRKFLHVRVPNRDAVYFMHVRSARNPLRPSGLSSMPPPHSRAQIESLSPRGVDAPKLAGAAPRHKHFRCSNFPSRTPIADRKLRVNRN